MSLIAGERSVEECVHNLNRQSGANHTAAHGHDICVIVKSGCLRAEAVGAKCTADTFKLVCCDGDTDAGTANQDALLTLSALDSLRYQLCVDGVIHRFGIIAAKIMVLNLIFLQICNNFLL